MPEVDKVEFGLCNIVYAVVESEENNTITYGTPKSFLQQGCYGINVALQPVGDSNEKYGDNVVVVAEDENQGYDGDLQMTRISDDFKIDVLGYKRDLNGGVLEKANATPKKFALGFQVNGDKTERRTWYYYVSANRPNDDHATNTASRTYADPTMSIKARPRPTDMAVKFTLPKTADNVDVFDDFFDEVYEFVASSV